MGPTQRRGANPGRFCLTIRREKSIERFQSVEKRISVDFGVLSRNIMSTGGNEAETSQTVAVGRKVALYL